MRLSDQALASLMMALQKCLAEQVDIVPILRDLNFKVSEKEKLEVTNPPSFKFDSETIKSQHNHMTVEDSSEQFTEEKSTVGSD